MTTRLFRHFPAVNWLTSYRLYQKVVDQNLDGKFEGNGRSEEAAMVILSVRPSSSIRPPRRYRFPRDDDRLLMQATKMIGTTSFTRQPSRSRHVHVSSEQHSS